MSLTEIPNFGVPDDTLIAVILGALLATAGGFTAARLEAWLRRREREREGALLLGEIIFTFGTILRMAEESRAIGDPWGPITVRMLYGARREATAYERNRERLADLRDAGLRIKSHTLMVTLTMSLEGVIEAIERIDRAPDNAAGRAAYKALAISRNSSMDFIAQTIAGLDPLLVQLGTAARTSFAGHAALVRA